MGYLDIHIRVYLHNKIENFHVVSLPINGTHTAAVMFEAFEKFFDVLCPMWKQKVLSCASDGEAKMTGHINGFATHREKVALPGLICIWYEAHQLDIVMHRFYVSLLNKQFYKDLTWLMDSFVGNKNLKRSIGSKCPKVATTRWLSISNVTCWLCKHRVAVCQLLDKKNPLCKPGAVFWVVLFIIDDIAQQAAITFKSLQALNLILSQQQSSIQRLQFF